MGHEGFEFDLPVWCLVDRDEHHRLGMPFSLVRVKSLAGGERVRPGDMLLTLFTDQGIAGDYIAKMGDAQKIAVPIERPETLVGLLLNVEVDYVVFDATPSPGGGTRGYSCRPGEVVEFVRAKWRA